MGNNYGMDSRRILAPSGLTKPENSKFLVIFSILGGVQEKSIDLPTSPINQFRDYFNRNRIEKLVPVNYRFPTGNKKHQKKSTKPFSNLDFWPKSGFPKNWDLTLGLIWRHLGLLKAFGSKNCNTCQLKCNSRRKSSKRQGVLKVGVTKSCK